MRTLAKAIVWISLAALASACVPIGVRSQSLPYAAVAPASGTTR